MGGWGDCERFSFCRQRGKSENFCHSDIRGKTDNIPLDPKLKPSKLKRWMFEKFFLLSRKTRKSELKLTPGVVEF